MPNPASPPPPISLARLAELAQKVNASQHPDYVCCIHERFGENQCCGVHQNLVDATRKSAPALLAECKRLRERERAQREELRAERAEIERLRGALVALSAAVEPLRSGKRDGGTMGGISIADDAARAALSSSRVPCERSEPSAPEAH